MRTVDYWAGVPLCFVLTAWRKIFGLGRSKVQRPQKVLFIELSEMGTAILADPAMRRARDKLGAEPFFVIFERNAASLDFLRTVSSANIFTIRNDNLFVLAIDSLRLL